MPKKTGIDEVPVQEELQNEAPIEAAMTENPENPAEQGPTESEGKKKEVPAVKVQEPVAKKVRIMIVQDVDCLICGKRYEYPTQKMVEVPEDVAQILVFGKKAYRM
jgi:hypothetical protein